MSCHPISSHLISSFDTDFFGTEKTFRQMMTYAFTQKSSYTHVPRSFTHGNLVHREKVTHRKLSKTKKKTTHRPLYPHDGNRMHEVLPRTIYLYHIICTKQFRDYLVITTSLALSIPSTISCYKPRTK